MRPKSKTLAVPPAVRKSEVWRGLKPILAQEGLAPAFGRGTRHWYLEVPIRGTLRKHFIPVGGVNQDAVANNVATFRRLLKEERAR